MTTSKEAHSPLAGLTNPVTGAEISETVTASKIWNVMAIALTLVTDATVANRDVALVIEDGSSNEVYRQQISSSITASQTGKIFIAKWGGSQPADSGLLHYLTLPDDFELPAGFVVKTVTANLQAADDFAAPIILAIEHDVLP